MIKCEVVFDGDDTYCNGLIVKQVEGQFTNYYDVDDAGYFDTLEQAIAYCMEQSN